VKARQGAGGRRQKGLKVFNYFPNITVLFLTTYWLFCKELLR
jgi:hypothetical protein